MPCEHRAVVLLSELQQCLQHVHSLLTSATLAVPILVQLRTRPCNVPLDR